MTDLLSMGGCGCGCAGDCSGQRAGLGFAYYEPPGNDFGGDWWNYDPWWDWNWFPIEPFIDGLWPYVPIGPISPPIGTPDECGRLPGALDYGTECVIPDPINFCGRTATVRSQRQDGSFELALVCLYENEHDCPGGYYRNGAYCDPVGTNFPTTTSPTPKPPGSGGGAQPGQPGRGGRGGTTPPGSGGGAPPRVNPALYCPAGTVMTNGRCAAVQGVVNPAEICRQNGLLYSTSLQRCYQPTTAGGGGFDFNSFLEGSTLGIPTWALVAGGVLLLASMR